jgi:hypothetical protein
MSTAEKDPQAKQDKPILWDSLKSTQTSWNQEPGTVTGFLLRSIKRSWRAHARGDYGARYEIAAIEKKPKGRLSGLLCKPSITAHFTESHPPTEVSPATRRTYDVVLLDGTVSEIKVTEWERDIGEDYERPSAIWEEKTSPGISTWLEEEQTARVAAILSSSSFA